MRIITDLKSIAAGTSRRFKQELTDAADFVTCFDTLKGLHRLCCVLTGGWDRLILRIRLQ